MFRVTTGMLKDTMLYNLGVSHREMNTAQNQIATGKKAEFPHQDPSGTINSMLFKSRITELGQFQENIDDGESRLRFYDTALQSTGDILQRLKELSVQAANGSYNDDDRKIAAAEVDQLLKQMIDIANTRYIIDETIFQDSGRGSFLQGCLREGSQLSPRLDQPGRISGDIGIQKRDRAGAIRWCQSSRNAFSGATMRISSTTPGTDYRATRDQVFRIDGVLSRSDG